MILIGIDTGTYTGLAVWDTIRQEFLEIETTQLHKALEKVYKYATTQDKIKVVFEDARQRTWYGVRSYEKLQGAGSVKRDCNIWEEFLTDHKIEYWARPPVKGATKMNAAKFRAITKYKGRTSEHSRDAAMLVFEG